MAGPKPAFAGELGVLGLFDLGQVLMLNRATGCLTVFADGKRGALYFADGRIVNAVDERHREGEDAAYRIFGWTGGRFEFQVEPASASITIENGTESLMLEAARRMDEAGQSGATEKLREKRDTLESLRQAFKEVVSEARSAAPETRAALTVGTLDHLHRPDDVLLIRPGHAERIRLQGQWRIAREATLEASEYLTLRGRLLAGAAEDATEHVCALGEARRVRVTRFGSGEREVLWVRPAELPAPTPDQLVAPADQRALFGAAHRGLVLVGGPDSDTAARALHALVAARLADDPSTLVLVSERAVYRHVEGAGVLVEAAPAQLPAALAAAEPDALALDCGALPTDGLLRGFARVRLLIARVATDDGAALLEAWRSGFGPEDRAAIDAFLSHAPVLLVTAHRPIPGDVTLPVNAWEPSPEATARLRAA